MANRSEFERLFAQGDISVARGALFDRAPTPLPAAFDFDRVEGMLLGVAIGDGLGNTTESQLPEARRAAHGEIRDYLPNTYARGRMAGVPSDDTQLTFWTLEQMLVDGGVQPRAIADRFCRERIYGIGQAVKEFITRRKAGLPWYQCGTGSSGNGALMRIAPALLPHLRQPSTNVWTDTALLAMITHNDFASIATCLAFAAMLWDLLGMAQPPEPAWWVQRYVEVARDLEGETTYKPRNPALSYRGPLWRFVEEQVPAAYAAGLTVLEASNRWYSGAYLLETVPTTLYALMRHAADPEEAMVRVVNDTKDNDTVAAIAGAALGALYGTAAFPARWRKGLLGRTGTDDDGRIFELIAAARSRWWDSA